MNCGNVSLCYCRVATYHHPKGENVHFLVDPQPLKLLRCHVHGGTYGRQVGSRGAGHACTWGRQQGGWAYMHMGQAGGGLGTHAHGAGRQQGGWACMHMGQAAGGLGTHVYGGGRQAAGGLGTHVYVCCV